MNNKTAAAVIVLATGVLLGACGASEEPSAVPPAPEVVPLDATGFESLLEQSRDQVVLVNLWATWCAPCLKEIPELVRLEAALPESDFELIGIALDDAADRAVVEQFRDQWFPAFATYHSSEMDWYALVGVIQPNWSGLLPTTFVLDRQGELAATLTGGKSYEVFAEAVEPLL